MQKFIPKPFSLRSAEQRARKSAIRVAIEDDPVDAQIKRINDLTRAGRANWFGLLIYLAFTMVTVLGVQDADFFIDSRQTQLPLIAVSIPTYSFFVFAPVLGAALYIYLHLGIRKCIDALAAPPACVKPTVSNPKGTPLERHILPWLLNDLVLRYRGPDSNGQIAYTPRRLDRFATITAVILVWLAGPYVLAYMWWESMVAHALALTTSCGFVTLLTIYVGAESWTRLEHATKVERPLARLSHKRMRIRAFVLAIPIFAVGYDLTRGFYLPFDGLWGLTEPFVIKRANLTGVTFSQLPPDQVEPDVARHRFRADWCRRQGLRPDICGRARDYPAPSFQTELRIRWCIWHAMPNPTECKNHFDRLEGEFDAEWSVFRARTIAALDKPNLSGRDLRYANLTGAHLTGVNLSKAKLEGAWFGNADLQGVDLSEAQLANTFFGAADLHGANLSYADLRGAYLYDADLQGAYLWETNMQSADLGLARLHGAYIGGTALSASDWEDTEARASLAHFADFRNVSYLEQDHLQSFVGNAATLLPETIEGDKIPYVCSCWHYEKPDPPGYGLLVEFFARLGTPEERLRDPKLGFFNHFCSPPQKPLKTGTPFPMDEDPPWVKEGKTREKWAEENAPEPGKAEECPRPSAQFSRN